MKNSYKDNELFKTTPEYAIVNQCWSMKRFSYYFSPDGERFEAPSGFSRCMSGWRSRDVDGRVIHFFDKKYGGYRLSYDAAIAHHTATAPLMQGRRQRMILEKSCKSTPTGVPGLFIYPPKNSDLPLSRTNCWKIFAKAGNMRLKQFYTKPHLVPGDVEFDKQYLAASIYCELGRKKYIEKNKFVKENRG